nr:Ig-like domain-containing protein [Mycolicibacterium sphagni]
MYAAGSFHAVDDLGRPVDWTFVSQGATYTTAGNALVTINNSTGGYTYTPPAIWDPKFQNAAFFHRSTSENEADRYDTVNIPVRSADGAVYTLTFKISIIDGTNAAPTVSAPTVGSPDGVGVVKGKINASDSDGDTLKYSLVGSSVNGLSGNSAYTKNGAGNGGIVTIDPTTGDFTYVSSATAGATQSFQVMVNDGHYGNTVTTVTVTNSTAAITPANINTSTPYVESGSVPGSTNFPGVFTSYALGSATTPKGSVMLTNPTTGAFTYTSNVGRTTANDDVVTLLATDANGRTVTLNVAVKPAVVDNVPTVVVTTSPYAVAQAQNATGNALGTWSLNTSTWTQTTTGKLTWSDADSDPLTYGVSTNGQAGKSNNGGNVTLNANGTFTYTVVKNKAYYHSAAIYSPTQVLNAVNGTSANSAAADWFDVTVSDGFTGGTVTQRVYVPIYAVNATPTIAGSKLSAGSITFVGTNDADSEDTYGNFEVVVPSGWNYVGSGAKGLNTGTLTRLSGSNSASMTLYDRDGSGNRYYNVDAYGRTINTQGVTRTW